MYATVRRAFILPFRKKFIKSITFLRNKKPALKNTCKKKITFKNM